MIPIFVHIYCHSCKTNNVLKIKIRDLETSPAAQIHEQLINIRCGECNAGKYWMEVKECLNMSEHRLTPEPYIFS